MGKDYNGKQMIIENQSESPFIPVSNGAVVKDLEIDVTAESISISNNKRGREARYSYTGNESNGYGQAYGAVFGKIMGGDSVIDNVTVKYGGKKTVTETDEETGETTQKTVDYSTTVSLKTTAGDGNEYVELPAVGGYVGVLTFGGLVFRNMTAEHNNIGNLKVQSMKKSKDTEVRVADCMSAEGYLYVNPIVGRVVSGYCFHETESSYNYTEVTSILNNGHKNYVIPDVASGEGNYNKIKFDKRPDSTDYYDVINIKDSQSLFMLSMITQSQCGNANDSDTEYNTTWSYGDKYKTVHLGNYLIPQNSKRFSDSEKGTNPAITVTECKA